MRAQPLNITDLTPQEKETFQKMPLSCLVFGDGYQEIEYLVTNLKTKLDETDKSQEEKDAIVNGLVNEISVRGMRPLHWLSLKENSYRIAKFLIDNGADVNAEDGFGHNPLHDAAMNTGHVLKNNSESPGLENDKEFVNFILERTLPILDLLIAAGVDYKKLGYEKKSPMQYLCEAIPESELNAQFVKPNLSLPHLQKAVDEYFASARKSRDPSGHSTDSSDRHSSENEDPISSPVIPVKTGIQHSGRNSKTHAAKNNSNDEKKHCCIMM